MPASIPESVLPILLAIASAFVLTLSGCGFFAPATPQTAPAAHYVASAVAELSQGDLLRTDDLLARARERFPKDEAVLRWSVELHRMQWRELEALEALLELTRLDRLETVDLAEINGQIGELLFRLGNYGESVHYLRAGLVGEARHHRDALARLSAALPYVQPQIDYRPTETSLFADPWPLMRGVFGARERLCVIDTGSSMTTLAQTTAREVGVTDVREYGMIRDSLGRKHGAWIGVLPRLAVGEMQLGPLPVLIVEDDRLALRDSFGGLANPPTAVLGLDVIRRFELTIDLVQQLARFDAPEPVQSNAALRCVHVERCLLIPVQVDGVNLWFILDTAASHSSLTESGLAAIPGGERRASPDYRRHPKSLGGSSFISRKVTGLVLESSAVKFRGVEMAVVERASSKSFPVHGVIGIDLLQHCRLTMSGGDVLLEQISGGR